MGKKTTLLLLLFLITISCSKEEGYGGLSSISGKVFGQDYNSNGTLVSQDYIGEINVYISKHGSSNYFDRKDSAYNGAFKFSYLNPGKYDIWVFGDCDFCPWKQVYKLVTVEIGKEEEKTIDDIVVTF